VKITNAFFGMLRLSMPFLLQLQIIQKVNDFEENVIVLDGLERVLECGERSTDFFSEFHSPFLYSPNFTPISMKLPDSSRLL
jgi:hypothetical protein